MLTALGLACSGKRQIFRAGGKLPPRYGYESTNITFSLEGPTETIRLCFPCQISVPLAFGVTIPKPHVSSTLLMPQCTCYFPILTDSVTTHSIQSTGKQEITMARNRRGPKMAPNPPPAQFNGPRRRDLPVPPGTKTIYVGPLLDTAEPGNSDAPLTLAKVIGVTLVTLQAVLPALISWGVTVALIFGGCCSNVRPSLEPSPTRVVSRSLMSSRSLHSRR